MVDKEKIGLAKEHIELAEQLIDEEAKDVSEDSKEKEFLEAKFALEKADAEIEDLEKI